MTADDGVEIAYQVIGEGPIDLIYVPGGQMPSDLLWDLPAAARFLSRLASVGRLVLYDPPGWGASSMSTRMPAVEVFADHMMAVADHVGLRRPAVVAWSEGGVFALYAVAAHPDAFSALVLVNAYPRFLRDDDYPHGMPASLLPVATDIIVEQWGTGENLRLQAASVADDEATRDWFGRCERLACAPSEMRDTWTELVTRDLRPVLPAIRVPTLVLHRRDNPHVRLGHGRYLAEHIPGATLEVVEGIDHLPFVFGRQDTALTDRIEQFLTGRLPSAEDDRVLATVMFTDIVNSTEQVAAIGDHRWRQLFDDYDDLARRQISRFRGLQVKTTGDGTLATFDGPARAIRCAHALRRASEELGITLRCGLHTGEIELRADDVAGVAVVIGQRISALAGPGEVLVSSTVRDLVAGSGIEFEDRGEHQLKGVPRPWRIFATTG